MNQKDIDRLKEILQNDFDDIESKDMFFLKNKTREVYRLSGDTSITKTVLLRAYLLFKRKYITTLPTLYVSPKVLKKDGGVFGVDYSNPQPQTVTAYDGLSWESRGVVSVGAGMYPLMSVAYEKDETLLYCLHPQGFLVLSSKQFDFDA